MRSPGRPRRRTLLTLVITVFLSGVTAVVTPATAAAAGPSTNLPTIPSVPVTEQSMNNRPQDLATRKALHGDQTAGAGTPDGEGTSKATSLGPSATWDVAQRTGDFSWSYPLRVPPSPGGLNPNLALSYSSSVVDGHTSATNNQPSWVGDGWSLSAGFIERTYGGCSEDTEGGTTPPTDSGDLCWRSDNAMASFGAGGGPLIKDDTTHTWRPKQDDGSQVEYFPGAGHGHDDGEYWKITTVDGTQYFFGSRPDAKSAWTVPVFGDDANEPCHGATFDTSWCTQTWRWNLDKVVDRHGNAVLYYYDTETNSYGLNRKDDAVAYIRGGTLARIEYGLREGSTDRATGLVWFTPADRCVPGSACTPDKKDNWPDVPWDDKCDTSTCKDRHYPTFWSTKRLDHITTQVWRNSSYMDVDSWTLEHQYPDPGDGEKAALWLRSIKHTGLLGTSATTPPIVLPPVVFEGTPMANRVTTGDGLGPINRYRVTGVVSEAGGATSVNYAPPDCAPGSVPAAPENNTKRCYPARWLPKYATTERTDYFHKYVVDTVVSSDRLTQNPADPAQPLANPEQLVRYEYLDGAAWHYSQSEFVKDEKKTWDEFRGYGRVRVHAGKPNDPSGPITMTEQRFYRGMDGDHLPNGTRPATVTDSEGGSRADANWLEGVTLESQRYNTDNNTIVTKTITTPVWRGPTATRGPYQAFFVAIGTTKNYTALAAGGWRTTQSDSTYDEYGQTTQVNDLGDLATPNDDRCATTTYVRNPTKWLMSSPTRVETVSVACGTTPVFPQNALSDVKVSYDGQDPGVAPTTGDVTRQEIMKDHPAGADPVYVKTGTATYDIYGRPLTTADALDRATKVTYEPATGGPETSSTLTNELGHTVTTTVDPAWGGPLKSTNTNGGITENAYDPLGRVVETWLPNRRRDVNSNRGNVQFAYQVRNDGPTVLTKTAIGPNGNYVSTNTLYDPQYRVRQVQAPTEGGRLLTDTRYDTQGRVYKSTQAYVNDAAVDTKLWVASDTEVPGLTRTQFDGAGRPTASIYQTGTQEAWRTTTFYGGDRVNVTPPAGGTPTTTITDARGQTTELWQYKGATPQGDHDTTRYTYTPAGRMDTATDPAGNTWRWTYDLRGRQITANDVDKGASTSTYDDADQLLTVTDARSKTLVYDYDRLGRSKTVREGNTTGPLRLEYKYDTSLYGKGKPASSTRYVDGNAYTQQVYSYGTLGQPTESSVVIPPSEGVLRGTYTTYFGYTWTGSLSSITYPKAGSMIQEGLSVKYDDYDRPIKSWSAYTKTVNLVTDTSYTRYGEPQRLQLGDTGKRLWLSSYYDTHTRRLNQTIVDAEVPAPKQSDVNYTRDPAGNILSIEDKRPGAEERQCFTYDYLHRLTEAWTPTSDCATAPTTGGLAGPAPYWQSFTYDTVGNRRTETQHSSTNNTTRTYNYPPTGHALQTVTTQSPGGSKTDNFGYDLAGNTTRRELASGTQTLDWDIEGRLSTVTEAGKSTSYIYDASGSRLLRKDPTGTTLYLGNQEIRLDTASGSVTPTRYYPFGNGAVAMRTPSGLTWLAGDHQGTPQISVDTTTLAVTQRRQTPFGAPRGPNVAFPGEKGFVGGTLDPSTGLTTLGARQYDPTTGRFISVDPLMNTADPQTWNGYTYSGNSPITSSDPSGLCTIDPETTQCTPNNWWHPTPEAPGGGAPPSAPGQKHEKDFTSKHNAVQKEAANRILLQAYALGMLNPQVEEKYKVPFGGKDCMRVNGSRIDGCLKDGEADIVLTVDVCLEIDSCYAQQYVWEVKAEGQDTNGRAYTESFWYAQNLNSEARNGKNAVHAAPGWDIGGPYKMINPEYPKTHYWGGQNGVVLYGDEDDDDSKNRMQIGKDTGTLQEFDVAKEPWRKQSEFWHEQSEREMQLTQRLPAPPPQTQPKPPGVPGPGVPIAPPIPIFPLPVPI